VGFAESEIQDSRLLHLHIFDRAVICKTIVTHIFPEVSRIADGVVERCQANWVGPGIEGGPAGVDRDPVALRIDDEGKDVPGTERGDSSLEARPPAQPFQDRHVGIIPLCIRINLVVWETCEDLIVTRIRKVPAVGDPRAAIAGRIAKYLTLADDRL